MHSGTAQLADISERLGAIGADRSSRWQRRDGLASVQYLRALAALMVVGYHVKPRLLRMGWEGTWPEWLSCGVDIFFVISGLIMWMTTAERAVTPGEFLRRRVLRIVPLYWAVTTLVVIVTLVAPGLVANGRLDGLHTMASFAFIPWKNPIVGTMEPLLPQGWTLNYEMVFYLVFAVALFLPKAIRAGVVLVALTGLVLAGTGSDPSTIPGFLSSSIILEFGLGVLIGAALTGGIHVGTKTAAVLLCAGAIALPATWPLVEAGLPRVWLSGVSAALIVGGAVLLETSRGVPKTRLLRFLGDASYSIYLVHGLALSAFAAIWVRVGLSAHPAALLVFVPLSIVIATAAGALAYLMVEKPLQALTRRKTPRTRALPA